MAKEKKQILDETFKINRLQVYRGGLIGKGFTKGLWLGRRDHRRALRSAQKNLVKCIKDTRKAFDDFPRYLIDKGITTLAKAKREASLSIQSTYESSLYSLLLLDRMLIHLESAIQRANSSRRSQEKKYDRAELKKYEKIAVTARKEMHMVQQIVLSVHKLAAGGLGVRLALSRELTTPSFLRYVKDWYRMRTSFKDEMKLESTESDLIRVDFKNKKKIHEMEDKILELAEDELKLELKLLSDVYGNLEQLTEQIAKSYHKAEEATNKIQLPKAAAEGFREIDKQLLEDIQKLAQDVWLMANQVAGEDQKFFRLLEQEERRAA